MKKHAKSSMTCLFGVGALPGRRRGLSGLAALLMSAVATLPGSLEAQLPVGLRQIPQSGMAVSASYTVYDPALAIDGDIGTAWQIRTTMPQWIQLDLGARHTIGAIELYSGPNYRIRGYRVYVSDEAVPSPWDRPVAEGEASNTAGWHSIAFDRCASGRYVRLDVTALWIERVYIHEIRLYGNPVMLADLDTANETFTNSNTVDVVNFPEYDGYTHFQIVPGESAPDSAPESWTATNTPPESLLYAEPSADVNLLFSVWFTNLVDTVPPLRNVAQIIYTTASPLPVVYPTLIRYLFDGGGPIELLPADLDAGASPGAFEGKPIGVPELSVQCVSDATPAEPQVTLTSPGVYEVVFTVVNAIGYSASATSLVSVVASDPDTVRVWTGSGADAKASTPANWADNTVPVAGDHVVFDDAHFGNAQTNVTWDLNVELTSWTQTTNYNGTVTLNTRYPEVDGPTTFTNLVVHGNCTLEGGVWTHPANAGNSIETDRLAASVGGNFVLGASAAINVNGRGYAAARGPGAGNSTSNSSTGIGASHGGHGGPNSSGVLALTYGDFISPRNLGSGASNKGGGAVLLSIDGGATLDGQILADGLSGGYYCGAAGGSILVQAASVQGAGLLQARGGTGRTDGGGGRIAVQLSAANDFDNLDFDATGQAGGVTDGSAAGTVYLEGVDVALNKVGRLIIDGKGLVAQSPLVHTPIPGQMETYTPTLAATNSVSAHITLEVPQNSKSKLLLTSDVRFADLAWLAGDSSVDLYGFTLFFVNAEPAGFPDLSAVGSATVTIPTGLGGGTIIQNGGRVLWGNASYTTRFFAWSGPNGTIANYDFNGLYNVGEPHTVTAQPNVGYAFLYWQGSLPEGADAQAAALTFDVHPESHFRAVFVSTAANTRTWFAGLGSDGLASSATNWYPSGTPQAGEHVILDSASYVTPTWDANIADLYERWNHWIYDSVDLTWDMEPGVEPVSWTQTEFYTGMVTLPTRYPEVDGPGTFTNFVINGDCIVEGGVWTHPANTGNYNETDRLAVSVVGDFTLGAAAVVDLTGRGYAAERGPGAGNHQSSSNLGKGGAHGGQGGMLADGSRSPTYGDFRLPTHLGSGASSRGGGALELEVGGLATINGQILSDGLTESYYCGAAGGSILLRTASLAGNGRLQARGGGDPARTFGGGGRIAVHVADNSDFADLVFDARGRAFNNDAMECSAPGSVYLEGLADTGVRRGSLVIDGWNQLISTNDIGQVYMTIPADLEAPQLNSPWRDCLDVALVITNRAQVALNLDLVMHDLSISDDVNPTGLHLQGHTLFLRSAYHEDWGHDDWVVAEGGQIIWALPGTVLVVR